MTYPAALEQFWISRAREAAGHPEEPDTALRRMEPKVQALSDLFTAERPDRAFPDYFADRALLAAYGVFFFPQSFAKAAWALEFAARRRRWRPAPGDAPLRVLDLGAGAGPCGLALALALHAEHPARKIHLTALDHSPHALAALGELAQLPESAPWLTLETIRHDLNAGALPGLGGGFDLVVAGFVLNETLAGRDLAERTAFVRRMRPWLADHGLLILLEPAFKLAAEPLVRLSDALADGPDFFRFGPQLSADPCPLLDDPQYWDHEVRRWTPPASLEFLNRRLFRDTTTLKFSCALLGAARPAPWPPAPPDGAHLRLISPLTPLKGRFVFSAVTAQGRKVTVQVPLRGMSRREEKEFELKFERGDVITCRWTALKENGLYKAEAGTLTTLRAAD